MNGITLEHKPIAGPPGSKIDIGIEVSGLDLENLTDAQFDELRQTLYEHQVVVIKGQQKLSPRAQYSLTKRFDPSVEIYSHGKSIDKRSILHADLKTIPSQPQVQVIGHGHVKSFEGLTDIQLRHPHHKTFHRHPVSEADDLDYTHFYRWHIDSAMYDLDPPLVTSLLAVKVPQGRRQTCRYDDGSGDVLDVPLGTTAFFSGYKLYDLLSEEEKEFVRGSKVEYAAHPYIWISEAKARSNGLGIVSEGLELPEDRLPAIDQSKVKIYPMVWKNPVTGRLALMVYPTPVRRIHLANGEVLEDLPEIREKLYGLQRRGIDPCYIYPHDWEEGDLVLFNNHGVMHSIVGSFAEDEVRIFRQCNMAASRPPIGPDTQVEAT
ncbi:alpha-ketoglutarate dependent xanthine dioxygenase [Xylariales sp. PMI_506]|nr:alpha-ketoglutarate dependent xanthine dioxygenase [Xylariales sp. PMI_506]